jgi:hypothetical protein
MDEMKLALEISKHEEEQRARAAQEEEEMIRLAIEASMALVEDAKSRQNQMQ